MNLESEFNGLIEVLDGLIIFPIGIIGKGKVVVAESEGGCQFHQFLTSLYRLYHIPFLEIGIG